MLTIGLMILIAVVWGIGYALSRNDLGPVMNVNVPDFAAQEELLALMAKRHYTEDEMREVLGDNYHHAA